MHIRIGKGVDMGSGVPRASPVSSAAPEIARWALDGRDFPGLRVRFAVAAGDEISAGQVLFADRDRSGLVARSPVSGRVTELLRRHPATGAFRLIVTVDEVSAPQVGIRIGRNSADEVRDTILRSGLWPALREHPFGAIANPSTAPGAILVCATPADPHAPDPLPIVSANAAVFADGLAALRKLTGRLVVSQPKGELIAENAVIVEVRYPAGLPGAQIHALRLMTGGDSVWWLNYEDAIAIGRLFAEERLDLQRTIRIGGPAMREPVLLQTIPGAAIDDLVEVAGAQVASGGAIGGREDSFLGRYHLQATLTARPDASASRWSQWLDFFAKPSRSPVPAIPLAAHRIAFPFDMPVIPLLRSLAIGDVESAARLGCLELVEEDVTILSRICPSGADYGVLLRCVLDEIRRSR